MFGVEGSALRVWGLGFRVQVFRFRVYGVEGCGFRVTVEQSKTTVERSETSTVPGWRVSPAIMW